MSVKNPNKKIFLVIGLVFLLALVAIAGQKYLSGNLGGNKQDPKKTSVNYKKYKACDLLKLDEAKKIAGDAAVAVGEPRVSDINSDDSNDSSCAYTFEIVSGNTTTLKTVDVRALSAQSASGEQTNKAAFNAKETAGAKKIDGYGEASWKADSGELSILKQNTFLTITVQNATVVAPVGNTTAKTNFEFKGGSFEDAKKVADIVITRL